MIDKVSTVTFTLKKTEKYLSDIIEMSKQDNYFKLLMSIPGIGKNLAASCSLRSRSKSNSIKDYYKEKHNKESSIKLC